MTSISENLARVRTTLADHDEQDATHAHILDAYAEAIREHEAQLEGHRDAIERHSRKRRREGREGRREERGGRFRFKEKGTSSRARHREGGRKGHVRRDGEGREKVSGAKGGGDGDADKGREEDVQRYAAHPLPRPEEEGWLDPSLGAAGEPDNTRRWREARAGTDTPATSAEEDAQDPDEAFKTSLFDALADDEGAASYWEGVYSQPLNVYPRPRVRRDQDVGGGDEDGEEYPLEEMGDEEYVHYVKRKMWEKANPHLVREMKIREERERDARERRERRRRGEKSPSGEGLSGRGGFMDDVEAALARGERRRAERLKGNREKERWERAWEKYIKAWKGVEESRGDGKPEIPWLVETRRMEDAVVVEKVQAFLEAVMKWVLPRQLGKEEEHVDGKLKVAILKAERFRWHPDKIQHRFGGRDALGEKVMEAVTGVFQVIDRMLDEKKKA